jgi:1,4-dihydroxy-2-naphthoate octaprenyltransferase
MPILSLSRPRQLILVLLNYGLGLAIARYLGQSISLPAQFIGGLILILLLAASALLAEHFRPYNEPLPGYPDLTRAEREALRAQLLAVGISLVGVAFVLGFVLAWQGLLPLNAGLLLVIFLLFALAQAIPPLRLLESGFGELIQAILLAALAPAAAFVLQTGELHRLVTLLAVPLFLLGLAGQLAVNFPAYADDLKYQRSSLLMRLTWQNAVPVHNGLLAAAYLIFAALPTLGIPLAILWPAFLTLPLAAYQIFMLSNIASGTKPLWTVFTINAVAIFGLTAYLLTLTFWLR